jgi:transcriptional regulator with XRE-family HTH domain
LSQSRKKKRTPRYSEAKKAEVRARKVQGESERSIALYLGMSRNTVARIRDDREFRNIVGAYRREAAKLIEPALKVLEKTLDQTDGPEEVEDREFSKIEVLDGKELAKMIRRVRRDAWKQGFKAGADGLKAALGTLGGTSVFTSRQHVEVETGQDPFEGMSLEELESQLQVLYAHKSRLQAIE